MKKTFLYACLLLLMLAGMACSKTGKTETASTETPQTDTTATTEEPVAPGTATTAEADTTASPGAVLLLGDFDGDGTKETATLITPPIRPEGDDCEGECDCEVKFSDGKIESFKIKNCIGGVLVNEGDLNEDGTDEISIIPGWFTSCWQRVCVYGYRKGEWKEPVKPIRAYVCNDEEQIDRISKDKKGFVKIVEDEMNEDGDMKQNARIIPIE